MLTKSFLASAASKGAPPPRGIALTTSAAAALAMLLGLGRSSRARGKKLVVVVGDLILASAAIGTRRNKREDRNRTFIVLVLID
mmetsp:Transcript_25476/g.72576  ORF Transcript_25476/g.72576 Transcript_25476/m.72576 type:complete len:84 (-) Transcript_25476:11-262(-)